MHPRTHPTIEPSPESLGLCETCLRWPAVTLDILEQPICGACQENQQEAAWVRSNEDSQ